jgi:16S rRNA (cytidine1402-2'-O)-methyltransferase
MSEKKIFLLPNLFEFESDYKKHLPPVIEEILNGVNGLIAESEKAGRRYLIKFLDRKLANDLPILLLNEHTKKSDMQDVISNVKGPWALISDSGLPCIADPGSDLIRLAYKHNIEVEAIVGPSAVIMAIMLSGLSHGGFAFHGYLPKENDELKGKLKIIQKNSIDISQSFIDAPYRFLKMLNFLVETLDDNTHLFVGMNLMLKDQKTYLHPISHWKKLMKVEDFPKKALAVFVIKKGPPY